MNSNWLLHPILRNAIGLTALLAVYYIPDRMFIGQREGWLQIVPYLFIVVLYAWIVFHNRVLFDRLYLQGRKKEYVLWTGLMMIVGSVNTHLVISTWFEGFDTISRILPFWIFNIAGLGIYILFRYRQRLFEKPQTATPLSASDTTTFDFTADGEAHKISYDQIVYAESLENYIRLITVRKIFLIRLSLKESEQRLPSTMFLRISRSHIINTSFVERVDEDTLMIRDREFKIGKVYKKYVKGQLAK